MTEKYKQKKVLERVDNILLLLISVGGDTLTYLNSFFDMPKTTLRERIVRLDKLGLVESIENNQKYISRKYILTDQGEVYVRSLDLITNVIFLKNFEINRKS